MHPSPVRALPLGAACWERQEQQQQQQQRMHTLEDYVLLLLQHMLMHGDCDGHQPALCTFHWKFISNA
jgi:hypothetical protein